MAALATATISKRHLLNSEAPDDLRGDSKRRDVLPISETIFLFKALQVNLRADAAIMPHDIAISHQP